MHGLEISQNEVSYL